MNKNEQTKVCGVNIKSFFLQSYPKKKASWIPWNWSRCWVKNRLLPFKCFGVTAALWEVVYIQKEAVKILEAWSSRTNNIYWATWWDTQSFRPVVPNRGAAVPWGAIYSAQGCRGL